MTPEDVRRNLFRIDLAIRYEMGAIPFRHFGPPVSAEVGLALHVAARYALRLPWWSSRSDPWVTREKVRGAVRARRALAGRGR